MASTAGRRKAFVDSVLRFVDKYVASRGLTSTGSTPCRRIVAGKRRTQRTRHGRFAQPLERR